MEANRAIDRIDLITEGHLQLLEARFVEQDDRLDRAAKLLTLAGRGQRCAGEIGNAVINHRLLQLGELGRPGNAANPRVQEVFKITPDRLFQVPEKLVATGRSLLVNLGIVVDQAIQNWRRCCGREISVSLHNAFLFPDKPLAHFDYTTLRWIAYAIPIYVLPIALVFILRTLVFRHQREQFDRYYGFYMAMMITGFIVSTTASALILELTYYKANFSFLESFIQHMRWGILPALMCGFVAYRMDTPVSESEALGKLIMAAALRFLGWGSIAVIIMLYATGDLTIQEPNLRFTLVGTAFFVVSLLGASARFKTARPDD